MAKEYIEREAALHIARICHPANVESEIAKLPAADVRTMVKAEWLPFGKRGIYGMMYACSSCRAKYDGKTNFCPNCGAKMEVNDS